MADDKNNTGNRNTGNRNTGTMNTGNRNTGTMNTGTMNTGTMNTGNWNTGNWNTGNWNTGNWNTGYFNVDTPATVRAFGKDCQRKAWDNAAKPIWIRDPSPTTWVPESEMTDQEKVENSTFNSCQGYLRVNDWMDEWRKAYDAATPEDIALTRALPNFDAAIFRKITGIDLDAPVRKNPAEIVIDGATYVLKS